MMTAFGDEELEKDAKLLGAAAYLNKPLGTPTSSSRPSPSSRPGAPPSLPMAARLLLLPVLLAAAARADEILLRTAAP